MQKQLAGYWLKSMNQIFRLVFVFGSVCSHARDRKFDFKCVQLREEWSYMVQREGLTCLAGSPVPRPQLLLQYHFIKFYQGLQFVLLSFICFNSNKKLSARSNCLLHLRMQLHQSTRAVCFRWWQPITRLQGRDFS